MRPPFTELALKYGEMVEEASTLEQNISSELGRFWSFLKRDVRSLFESKEPHGEMGNWLLDAHARLNGDVTAEESTLAMRYLREDTVDSRLCAKKYVSKVEDLCLRKKDYSRPLEHISFFRDRLIVDLEAANLYCPGFRGFHMRDYHRKIFLADWKLQEDIVWFGFVYQCVRECGFEAPEMLASQKKRNSERKLHFKQLRELTPARVYYA